MTTLKNYINGSWAESRSSATLDVINPATALTIARVPAGSKKDILNAVEAASEAAPLWRNTPASQRIQYLFNMKQIFEANTDLIAEIRTKECGKTFAESKAEMIRAVENIEVACESQPYAECFSEDIATGVDEFVIRQPLGVGACISPFNFPIMIPFWRHSHRLRKHLYHKAIRESSDDHDENFRTF